ncbi:MAG: hypothetical protein ACI8Z1_000960 [Candidatus Azotimanducaceae bacterium]
MQQVGFDNGTYAVLLGGDAANLLPADTFQTNQVTIGIQSDSDTELNSRMTLGSVPYAFKASESENAIGNITPSSVSVINSLGQVTPVIDVDGKWLGEAIASEQGSTGQEGAQGSAVVEGTIGLEGPEGAAGPEGPQGLTGPTGAKGIAGSASAAGDPGAQGPQGDPGAQGDARAQGSAGAQGVAGSTGSQGATGSAGVQRDAGPQGSQGLQGATGAQGSKGPSGGGHTGAIYRWNVFSTYDQSAGWISNNKNTIFGSIAPRWSDSGATAEALGDVEQLRDRFTRKGYGGLNANVVANTWSHTSSTNGKIAAALFRFKNKTDSSISWTVNTYQTAYYTRGERASVAVNGV